MVNFPKVQAKISSLAHSDPIKRQKYIKLSEILIILVSILLAISIVKILPKPEDKIPIRSYTLPDLIPDFVINTLLKFWNKFGAVFGNLFKFIRCIGVRLLDFGNLILDQIIKLFLYIAINLLKVANHILYFLTRISLSIRWFFTLLHNFFADIFNNILFFFKFICVQTFKVFFYIFDLIRGFFLKVANIFPQIPLLFTTLFDFIKFIFLSVYNFVVNVIYYIITIIRNIFCFIHLDFVFNFFKALFDKIKLFISTFSLKFYNILLSIKNIHFVKPPNPIILLYNFFKRLIHFISIIFQFIFENLLLIIRTILYFPVFMIERIVLIISKIIPFLNGIVDWWDNICEDGTDACNKVNIEKFKEIREDLQNLNTRIDTLTHMLETIRKQQNE